MLDIRNLTTSTLCCIQDRQQDVAVLLSTQHFDENFLSCFPDSVSSLDIIGILLQFHGLTRNTTSLDGRIKCDVTDGCDLPPTALGLGLFTFYMAVLLVALTGNCIVCIVVYKSTFLRSKITNYFIVSLAVSDLLAAVVVVPIRLYLAWHNRLFCGPVQLCRFYYTVDIMLFTASITNLFAIAADRYLALTRPYRYMETMTTGKAILVIACVWLYALLWGILFNFNLDDWSLGGIGIESVSGSNHCTFNNSHLVTVLYAFVFYVPLVLMGVAYAKILRIAIAHAHSIAASHSMKKFLPRQSSVDASPPSENSSSATNNNLRRKRSRFRRRKRTIHPEMKATKTVIVVYGTFLICFFPLSILSIVASWKPDSFASSSNQWYSVLFVEILPFLNTTMNPFIYGIMNTHFREGLMALFGTVKRYFGAYSVHRHSTKITHTSETAV